MKKVYITPILEYIDMNDDPLLTTSTVDIVIDDNNPTEGEAKGGSFVWEDEDGPFKLDDMDAFAQYDWAN